MQESGKPSKIHILILIGMFCVAIYFMLISPSETVLSDKDSTVKNFEFDEKPIAQFVKYEVVDDNSDNVKNETNVSKEPEFDEDSVPIPVKITAPELSNECEQLLDELKSILKTLENSSDQKLWDRYFEIYESNQHQNCKNDYTKLYRKPVELLEDKL